MEFYGVIHIKSHGVFTENFTLEILRGIPWGIKLGPLSPTINVHECSGFDWENKNLLKHSNSVRFLLFNAKLSHNRMYELDEGWRNNVTGACWPLLTIKPLSWLNLKTFIQYALNHYQNCIKTVRTNPDYPAYIVFDLWIVVSFFPIYY